MTMPDFIPGLDLAERFYHDAGRPLLDAHSPDLPHSAALVGAGSEVLGFDTAMSSDHHWGPRVMLFVDEADYGHVAEPIKVMLAQNLPRTFMGYWTHFVPVAGEAVTMLLADPGEGPIRHRVEVHTVGGFCEGYLGFNPLDGMTAADWLSTPTQMLRTMIAGRVFHDGLNALTSLREKLAWYPDDVWRYVMAAQWGRIAQEEPFVGRCGSVGDEVGSRIVAGRLVRDVMRLCFLMERQYAPYSKWFGTAFGKLACGAELTPIIEAVLAAAEWQARETHLARLYERVAAMHNALGLTEVLATEISNFHDRPFRVIHADRFAEALRGRITDAEVLRLPPGLGAVDQWVDSTDVLSDAGAYRKLVGLYR
jgi:hypothetical protein